MKTIDNEYIKGKKPTKSQRRLRMAYGLVLMVGLTMLFAITAISSTASAEIPGEDYAVQNSSGLALFMLGGVLAVVLVAGWKVAEWDLGGSNIGIVAVLSTVLLLATPVMIGAAVYFSEPEPVLPYCTRYPDDPSCIAVDLVTWSVVLEADLDVAGNTYPAAPMTVCDTAIGGTTGEWVAADNADMDMSNMMATTGVHIDTDLAETAGLWMDPNCVFIEIQRIQLLTGPKASSGAIETQQYYARIDSISMTRLSNDNATITQNVFHQDGDGQHHVGYQLEDGSWVEACPEYRAMALPTSGCGAIIVGTDDGTGDTTGSIATNGFRIWWVWEDRGPFSFLHTSGKTWTLTFSIGSESDWHTFTFVATMNESATDNT